MRSTSIPAGGLLIVAGLLLPLTLGGGAVGEAPIVADTQGIQDDEPFRVPASILAGTPDSTGLTEQQIHAAGFGAQYDVFDVETVTGNNLMLGVVYLEGSFFVTGGGESKSVYVLDEDGLLVRQFAQSATSFWGWRDGATDGASLMFGWEEGINVIDPFGTPVNTLITAKGPRSIVQPIAGDGLAEIGNYRAVAYNPMGDRRNGSFWVANFGSPLLEIDLEGNILTNHPNTPGWSIYGLAWDAHTNTLWANSAPNAGDIVQIDPDSGVFTGLTFPRNEPHSAQGGLSVIPLGGTEPFMLVGLDQATPDSITRYRVHISTDPFIDCSEEGRLLSAVEDGELDDTAVKTVFPGATVSVEIAQPLDLKASVDSHLIINKGDDAIVNGVTPVNLPMVPQPLPEGTVYPELVALSPFSEPPGDAVILPVETDQVVVIPGIDDLLHDEYMRVQAMYPQKSLEGGRMATNQLFFHMDRALFTVEAVGPNSFNGDTSSGFWRVTNRSGVSVVSVKLDWSTSSNPAQATMRFDTDQASMSDRFDGGNSTSAGCRGTFRNGSDVTTGLIYDGLNNPVPCDATANSGWIGTNPGTTAGEYRTLEFRFAPGAFANKKMLEFDVDTDGGAGINGAAMSGLVVTITLEDASVLTGELAADTLILDRSLIRFF